MRHDYGRRRTFSEYTVEALPFHVCPDSFRDPLLRSPVYWGGGESLNQLGNVTSGGSEGREGLLLLAAEEVVDRVAGAFL